MLPAIGVLSVTCPACRAKPGRPCANRRGYLVEHGSHHQRRALWLAEERAEARTVVVRASEAGATPPVCAG